MLLNVNLFRVIAFKFHIRGKPTSFSMAFRSGGTERNKCWMVAGQMTSPCWFATALEDQNPDGGATGCSSYLDPSFPSVQALSRWKQKRM